MTATGVGPTHYIKLYSSNLLKDKKLSDSEKRAMLDSIIDSIGVLGEEGSEVNPLHILCVSVTKNYDLVIGFEHEETAQEIIKRSLWEIILKTTERVQIPIGPLTMDGEINFKRYLVKTKGAPGLEPTQIVRALAA